MRQYVILSLELTVLLAVIAALLLTAGIWAACTRVRMRRLLRRLDAMLDGAIAGNLLERSFDESAVSSLESKMARYLRGAAVSAQNLRAEHEKITQLISDISHQTKTPVANLVLYAQLLGEQRLTPEGAQCAAALSQQAEKLRFLIDALVKTSRLETGILTLRPKVQSVQPMLESVLSQLSPKASAKGVALSCQEGDMRACFDAKWTAEALHNLVDNAIKYTPPGGSVAVSFQPYELFCRIYVKDTGIGILDADQAKIFARFYRAQGVCEQEGVGLGLYLARKIARAEGGYLKVSSAPGKGSTFSLFLSAG